MRVIGTAGHVDHGKSTLIEALTGTHPDRLKEEREREMTIDLGFAWMTLTNREEVGIVDVPGHRDFIANMLSGIGGIDAVLFIIAADEGVMPQTREHLAIIDLLQIQGGVIVLTKIDLVKDQDWLMLVEDDVRQVLFGTVLEKASIIPVSSITREGLGELVQELSNCLEKIPHRPDFNRPRLPIDRVFTISGFGTVVTGTLSDGKLQVGDEVEILPGNLKGRIRGLQSHKHKEEQIFPGSRTAVNLSGINVGQVRRGHVLAHPGDYKTTHRLDVRVCMLSEVSQPLRHNMEVKLYLGTAEVLARVRLLGSEVLQPAESGWLQLELVRPIVTMRGDRFILRRPSPEETIGGGSVIDPFPKSRHKRFAVNLLERLSVLEKGAPKDILIQAVRSREIITVKEAIAISQLEQVVAKQDIQELIHEVQLLAINESIFHSEPGLDDLITTPGYWNELIGRLQNEVENYHKAFPLKKGLSREELRTRLNVAPRFYSILVQHLISSGIIEESAGVINRTGYSITLSLQQQKAVNSLLAQFASNPYSPPAVKEVVEFVGDEVYSALLDINELVQVSNEIVFYKKDYNQMLTEVKEILSTQKTITAAQVRDHFKTSRKYALAFLEHLDAKGITVRDGDVRRLRNI